jgi:hypothetical protein
MVRSMMNGNKDDKSSSSSAMPLPEFAKYIPLRLSPEERSLLNVLEQTLHVSEYTDHVDVTSSRRGIKTRRILDGLLEAVHIATGLAVASGHERSLLTEILNNNSASTSPSTFSPGKNFLRRNKAGKKKKKKGKKDDDGGGDDDDDDPLTTTSNSQSSWASRDPKDNAVLFQTMFEVGRRNKVLNPNQMRTTYGKLMVGAATKNIQCYSSLLIFAHLPFCLHFFLVHASRCPKPNSSQVIRVSIA